MPKSSTTSAGIKKPETLRVRLRKLYDDAVQKRVDAVQQRKLRATRNADLYVDKFQELFGESGSFRKALLTLAEDRARKEFVKAVAFIRIKETEIALNNSAHVPDVVYASVQCVDLPPDYDVNAVMAGIRRTVDEAFGDMSCELFSMQNGEFQITLIWA